MARPLPVLNVRSVSQPASTRKGDVRLGVWIELVTILWMTIEASVAITVGFATRSVSLQGFGMDSIVELIAGGILLWRLLVEQRGGTVSRIEEADRRASWVTAISLFALAAYIVGDSALTFITQTRPESSWWGVGLALAAAIIMPLLWQSKLRVAKRIGSTALKADAACSVTVPTCRSPCLLASCSIDSLGGGGLIPWPLLPWSTSWSRSGVRHGMKHGQ